MKLLLVRTARFTRSTFWRDASSIRDTATLVVLPKVLLFGLIAGTICVIERVTDPSFTLGIDVTPYEVGGAALGLLLVLRTNEGIGRWWEARKLWGGITNASRNLAAAAIAYGPDDPTWRDGVVRWTIAYGHACRRSLRGERTLPEVAALVGEAEANRLALAEHMPSSVALILARYLREAIDRDQMDRIAFGRAEETRSSLIDLIGGCERILKTPLPKAYAVQIRRFIFAFLTFLPFGLIPKVGWWLSPLITMLVAYPLLSLDEIGSELQDPFSTTRLGHLDLDGITATIERNLLAMGEEAQAVA